MSDESAMPPDPLDLERLEAIRAGVTTASGGPIKDARFLLDTIDVLRASIEEQRGGSDHAQVRIRRLVVAERDVVGLRAEVASLTDRLTEQTYERDTAEQALYELRDNEPPRMYLPGDAEPPRDEKPEYPLVALALGSQAGRMFYRRPTRALDYPWSSPHRAHAVYTWVSLMDYAPLIDVTGHGAWDLIRHAAAADDEHDRRMRLDWRIEQELERAARNYPTLAEGASPAIFVPERKPAGSIEAAEEIGRCAAHALSRLPYYAAQARQPAGT